jgi:octaprenyl-diphosphate synthase
LAVVLPFESPNPASLNRLVELVAPDMERVNATILARTGSEVAMIPEVANHLIASGGKRLRPMLTLAMARLAGYAGDGHIKLAAAVEFMHTATLLHDDVVDESSMRRGKVAARMLWGNEATVLVGDFLLGQAFKMMVEVADLHALEILSSAAKTRPPTRMSTCPLYGPRPPNFSQRPAKSVRRWLQSKRPNWRLAGRSG